MNKKVIVFLLVLVGLGGFVWWKTSAPQSAQDRLAQAMRIMQGLESRAIPVALTPDQLTLLEQVYQDSLERIPNIQDFRNTDKAKLISTLKSAGLTGNSNNGLNPAADALIMLSSDKTDVFASKIDGYMTNLGTTVSGTVATNIKKLAQSVNTLTNDIRLTKLYVSWYEGIRGKICTTNDPDNDIYVSGEVKMLYSPSTSLQDTCGNNEVKQFKCINGLYEDNAEHISKTQCPNGCNGGVCLKEGATMSGEISLSMPETAAIGAPVQISVMTTGSDGLMNYNYTKPFFIIIAGDDDAIFPTGALRMMSGEATKNFEIKFSKAGTMTVTIRPKEGAEVSKTIVVGGGSTGGGGATVSCSSITGVSTNSCNRCVRFSLPSSSLAMNVFVPRTGIPAGNREVILTNQSAITAEKYQGAQVAPTGNITNLFNLVESSPTNTSWAWATMKSGNSITKWPIPDSINRNIPIYGIRFQVVSLFKNAANSVVPGTDTTSTECYFYYEQPATTPLCWNGVREGNEECDDGNTNNDDACANVCKNNTTTVAACTGTRPANSTIVANAGNTSRAWTYDGSPTGPYQSCSFKCQTGYSYNNNTCTPTQTTSTPVYTCTDSDGGADYYKNGLITQIQNGKPSTLNDSCAQDNIGELTEYYCMADGSGWIKWERHMCSNGCKFGACITVDTTKPTCTGERPSNSIILANVGNVSQDWSYSSNTSEYQKCSFKCEAGYLYSNNTCVLPQVTNSNKYTCTDSDGGKDYYKNGVIIQTYNGQPSTLNDSCSQNNVGELTEEYCRPDGSGLIDFERHMCPNGCQYGACLPSTTTTGTATTNVTSNATITCPTYTAPICTDGTLVDGGKDANGCAKASTCVKNTFVCPTYTPPVSNFCVGGQIIDGGTDANGCQKPATCGPKLITGAVTVDGVKDCWFGDTTKKITLGDFIGYQATTNSGIKYLDEILFYGATAPTANTSLTNILSYEDAAWTGADGSTPNNSTQLTNFFVLRTNSIGTRTWNIPTTGTKFYGCFVRGDRPNTW